ncbi:hypothetical protein ACIQV2_32925 [Streptomyces globosus]|uniref:hypothetical protein n=1 Tax=Streptomyces globosus TaxID=68209 RepID=UPI0031D4F115
MRRPDLAYDQPTAMGALPLHRLRPARRPGRPLPSGRRPVAAVLPGRAPHARR